VQEAEEEQAALLMAHTASALCRPFASRRVSSTPGCSENVPIGRNRAAWRLNERWVQQESVRLQGEIEGGCHRRYDPENLLPGDGGGASALSEERRRALMPAAQVLSKNARLHPRIKRHVMATIFSVVARTIP